MVVGLRRITCVLVFALALGVVTFGAWGAPDLVILHMNDTHGRLFAPDRSYEGTEGGAARLATVVREVRAEMPDRVLLLHAGDILSRGDLVTVHTGGEANIEFMNRLGYDAMTPGNGEFYMGLERTFKLKRLAKFPMIHAIPSYKDTGKALFKPYVVKKVNGIRVGIFGPGCIREGHLSARNLNLRNYIEAAEEHVPVLREKCDLLVVLSHLAVDENRDLASKVPGIQIMICGHTHSAFPEPEWLDGPDGGRVLATQTADYGRALGRIDVCVKRTDDGVALASVDARRIPLDDNVEQAPDIVAFLEEQKAPLLEQICVATETLEHTEEGETPMGTFLVNAIRSCMGTDIALLDRDAIGAGIDQGPVTLEDVYRVHPWRNHMVIGKMTAEQLLPLLDNKDILVAGCDARGSEWDAARLFVNDAPADESASFTVAMDDYLQGTTEGLMNLPVKRTRERVDTILHEYLKEHGVGHP